MKKLFCAAVAALITVSLFAQVAARPDALALYRAGRNLENAGRTADANNNYSGAVAVCQQEIAENPQNIESYVVLCWSLFRLKRYKESEKYSLEALKISPREYRITENLGETYFYLDNYGEALKNLEKYVDGVPNGDRASTAYFFIGEIYRIQGKPCHADISYSMAVQIEPSIPLWWYRLGTVREQSGYTEGAKAAFKRALDLRPDYPEAKQALTRLG